MCLQAGGDGIDCGTGYSASVSGLCNSVPWAMEVRWRTCPVMHMLDIISAVRSLVQ